ncbi:MAG: hypothetical protein IPH42_07160 [Bacteroidetes bacterium]|nr:hypothetical protein [Bacteroidota bacterium]
MPMEEYIQRRAGEAVQINLTVNDITYLVNTYGSDTEKIIELAYKHYQQLPDKADILIYAEILYSIHEEMTNNISDFVIRRTGRLYFDKANLGNEYEKMNDIISEILNSSVSEKKDNLLFFEEVFSRASEFK